jgi:hypothetical protein
MLVLVLVFRRGRDEGGFRVSVDAVPACVNDVYQTRPNQGAALTIPRHACGNL